MTAGIAANLLAMVLLAGYLLRRAFPATEAVRLRNALLLQPSRAEDFAWTPPGFPPGFKAERRDADDDVRAIVSELGVDRLPDDWSRAVRLAGHLTERADERGPLQADLMTSYRGIREGYGYCADFVKVFLALAHAAGLCARQWAFSFDGFGGHGHTFVEVFDRQRRRWLFLDVHGNFHFVDPSTGEPLGALDVRELLQGRMALLSMKSNGPGRPGFRYPEKALDYYRLGLAEWYLWWGNAVYSYYRHPAVAAAARLSNWLAHLVAIVVGVQPRIRILGTVENQQVIARMFRLRRQLLVIGTVWLLLLCALLIQFASRGGRL
ncbi:MAG: transglutaminase domain-containing protein [Aromatoleum sp.]|nr:transglutaminase domain-containing protein [Aromatoleum sp.]